MNIDFSKVVTAETKAEQASATRAAKIKAICRERIEAVATETKQNNVARKVTTYATTLLRGGTEAEAEAASGLANGDFATAAAFEKWREAMVTTCRAMISDPDADPTDDNNWPLVPDGVVELASRP